MRPTVKRLIAELRSYDKHNHRGKYAVLLHKAADELEKESKRADEAQEELKVWNEGARP